MLCVRVASCYGLLPFTFCNIDTLTRPPNTESYILLFLFYVLLIKKNIKNVFHIFTFVRFGDLRHFDGGDCLSLRPEVRYSQLPSPPRGCRSYYLFIYLFLKKSMVYNHTGCVSKVVYVYIFEFCLKNSPLSQEIT